MSSNSTSSEIRKFGIIAVLVFGGLCILALWRHKTIPVYIFGGLSLLGLFFLTMPGPFKPVYEAWMKLAHFMGKVVTTVILTLFYYLVITPAAWLKRIFGGSPLPLKPDADAESYWVARAEPAQPKDRFYLRY